MKIIKPRVVYLVAALFGTNGGVVGGAERHALELVRHMAEGVPISLRCCAVHSQEDPPVSS